jgi:hypothetical protein
MILPLLFPSMLERSEGQSTNSKVVMNSPTTTKQSSGFHILELHGGTLETGLQVLMAVIVALIALRLAVRYRKKRRVAADIIKDASKKDVELSTIPCSTPSRQSEAEVREEFTAVVLPMIARDREHFNRII